MSDKIEKVWSTKYALTSGINLVEVEVSGEYAYTRDRYRTQLCKGDWFRTKELAIANAEKRRQRKIASLRKSLAKFEKMTFGDADGPSP